ncbi:class I SAM-dependent methyltransferase [Chitinophagaceae bacterium LWZ2-11]
MQLELRTFTIRPHTVSLFQPKDEDVQKNYIQNKESENVVKPYWAKIWPASLAMSQFLVKYPNYIKGKTVVELAAGLGLPTLIASKYANEICCSDYLPEAVEVIKKSVEYNSITNVECKVLNWHYLPETLKPEVLLMSDVNYEPDEFNVLYKVFMQFLNTGTTIILSTPQRLIAKPFIEKLLPWVIEQEEFKIEETYTTVMVLRGANLKFKI